MKFRFQSFVDLQTSASSMQVIQWSVGGSEVIKRCAHLFGAYKYFKLGKISVKLVPASTLPVDPLQLSYNLDDPQSVDPRDQMNPGLVRITNGEDIFTDVSSLTAEQQEGMYNAMMLDPRWSKFMLQSGFRRSAYPLYWQVGQLHQDKYPGATMNVPRNFVVLASADSEAHHFYEDGNTGDSATVVPTRNDIGSSARGLFQVGHKGRLGFLPTDFYQQIPVPGTEKRYEDAYGPNNVPEVSVITCVLPKAFKTLYFYRCYITEEVIFSGLRSAPAITSSQGNIDQLYFGADQFIKSQVFGVQPGQVQYQAITPPGNNGEKLP